ncbi:MAG TPA: branched-chain amino acid ABC transporter permease [Geminicoccaceae bacterium]|nr:branched-chain amino acid ABC transporter permease [Geminicoccaceae bacterium]
MIEPLRRWVTPAMLASFVLFGTVPLWLEAVGLYSYLGVEVLIWVIFALGFNLLLGTTGLPSFGHGAFFGIGGYTMGLIQFELAPNLWLGLLGSVAVTAAVGGIVALFISHRRGIYYALMTIAFGQLFFFIASKWTSVTGGEDGMLNIARLPLDLGLVEISLQGNYALYYLVFALYVATVVLLWRLVRSPFGKVLRARKQNEERVEYLGYNVFLYKWAAFTISCAIAGLAGGLFAMAQQGAYVQVMSLQWSGIVVLMVLIGGGFVSFWGPVVGTILFFVARDVLGSFTETWLLWYGLMFMALVMFKPEGIAGMWQDLARRLRHNRGAGRARGADAVAALRR